MDAETPILTSPARVFRDTLTARRRARSLPVDTRPWDSIPEEDKADLEAAVRDAFAAMMPAGASETMFKAAAMVIRDGLLRGRLRDLAERNETASREHLKVSGTAEDPAAKAESAVMSAMCEAAATDLREILGDVGADGEAAPDVRPRADGRRGLDITCGKCGEDYGTNVPDLDEIECVECEAHRCPHCQAWFGGSKW